MIDRNLHAFITAAKCKSITAAARLLYVSPTSVMNRINRLEYELGITLFNRSKQGLQLTEAGKSLFEDALFIERTSQDAIEHARTIADKKSFVLRIAISMMNYSPKLMNLLLEVNSKEPRIEYSVTVFDDSRREYAELINRLDDSVDVIVSKIDFSSWVSEQAQTKAIFSSPLKVAVGPKNSLFSKSLLKLSDLNNQTIFTLQPGQSLLLDKVRNDLNSHKNIKINWMYVNNYDISLFNQCALSRNLLITPGDWTNVQPLLRPIDVDWQYHTSEGFTFSKHPKEKVRLFLETVDRCL